MCNASCLSQAWRHIQRIVREQVRLVPLSKVSVVKLMHPFTGVLRGHSAAFMQKCGERCGPGTSP